MFTSSKMDAFVKTQYQKYKELRENGYQRTKTLLSKKRKDSLEKGQKFRKMSLTEIKGLSRLKIFDDK